MGLVYVASPIPTVLVLTQDKFIFVHSASKSPVTGVPVKLYVTNSLSPALKDTDDGDTELTVTAEPEPKAVPLNTKSVISNGMSVVEKVLFVIVTVKILSAVKSTLPT